VPEPGDVDGEVDGADFLVWQRGLGAKYTPFDLMNSQNRFGKFAGPGASVIDTTSGAAIPEPATAVLMLAGAWSCCRRCRATYEVAKSRSRLETLIQPRN
jgi:hypothetical protein